MRKIFYLLFVLSFFSCEEEIKTNVVSGSLFLDCLENPASSSQIALKTLSERSFSDREIIASSFVDANGDFKFTYEMDENKTGFGDLIYVNIQGVTNVLERVPLNQNISATLYAENKSAVLIENNGSKLLSITDTLYYGINGKEGFVLGPASGRLDTLEVEVVSEYNATAAGTIYYGVGLTEFNASKEALSISDSVLRHKSVTLSGCSISELVDLGIN